MGREAEEEALLLLARLADGALRDAESLLERFLLLEGPLTRKEVERALGLPQGGPGRDRRLLARGKTAEALGLARRLYGEGYAPRSLVSGLLEVFREGLYAAFGLAGTPLPAPPQALIAAMTALDEAMERLARRSDALSLEVALLEAGRALAAEALPQPTGAPSPEVGPKPESPRPRNPQGPRRRPTCGSGGGPSSRPSGPPYGPSCGRPARRSGKASSASLSPRTRPSTTARPRNRRRGSSPWPRPISGWRRSSSSWRKKKPEPKAPPGPTS